MAGLAAARAVTSAAAAASVSCSGWGTRGNQEQQCWATQQHSGLVASMCSPASASQVVGPVSLIAGLPRRPQL